MQAPRSHGLADLLARAVTDAKRDDVNVTNDRLQEEGDYIDCAGDGSTIYIMVLGSVIFVVVWPFIVLDMKWFPLGRPAAALVGGTLMVVFHIVVQMEVYDVQAELGNMQTIFLLVGMMMLSYYFDREGLLRLVALWILGTTHKPFKHVLWKVCALSAVLSALVTNDATCLVITPLILNEFKKQGRSRKEMLPLTLGIATCANIGSAATIFGNPQNAFIASAANVALLEFFIALLPAATFMTVVNIGLLYLMYYKVVFKGDEDRDDETESIRDTNAPSRSQYTVPATLAEERESVALSYDQSHDPYLSSAIAREREAMYSSEHPDSSGYQRMPKSRSKYGLGYGRGPSPHPGARGNLKVPDIRVDGDAGGVANGGTRNNLKDLPESQSLVIDDREESEDVVQVKSLMERTLREKIFAGWLVFVTLLVVVLLAIPPPPVVPFAFNLGLVPLGAGIATMMADTILNKRYAYDAMLKIDWTVILMFMGLFIWLAGFTNTCFPELAFNKMAPYMNLHEFGGVLLFAVFVIIGSNIFSNVPLVILIVNRIGGLCGDNECQGPLGGLLLAWISTVAGNFTLIGSVANLIVAEKARSAVDYRLTFWNYLKFGVISTTIVLFGALPVVYFLGVVQ